MTYPYVTATGYKPSLHYLRYGAEQGNSPGPIFDATWYVNHYPDVNAIGENPLIHYLLHGETEIRRVRINSQFVLSYEPVGENELREILINSALFDLE